MGQACPKCEDGCGIADEEIEGEQGYIRENVVFFSSDGIDGDGKNVNGSPLYDEKGQLKNPYSGDPTVPFTDKANTSYVMPSTTRGEKDNLLHSTTSTDSSNSLVPSFAPSSTTTMHSSVSAMHTAMGLTFEGIRLPTTPITTSITPRVNASSGSALPSTTTTSSAPSGVISTAASGNVSAIPAAAPAPNGVTRMASCSRGSAPDATIGAGLGSGQSDSNVPSSAGRRVSNTQQDIDINYRTPETKASKKKASAVYEGDLSASGRKHGMGRVKWSDGRVYEGQFLKDQFHGYGEFLWDDGRRYAGDYECGRKHGFGIFSWPDGRKYEGQWGYGKRHGKGFYTDGKNFQRNALWENDEPIKWDP